MRTLYWTSYAFLTRVGRAYSAFRRRMLVRMAVGTRTPKAFVSHPEPKSIGSYTRGQQMMVGNFQLGGQLVEAPDKPIWAITGSKLVLDDLHGCAWVDDLAATGHASGRRLLQAWIAEWIRLYGAGTGHGWRPDLTGQRLIHWISHGITIMQGQDKAATNVFLKSVARQARFLSRTWKQVPRGLPRLRALVGLLYASLALEGRSRDLKPTLRRLGRECRRSIGPEGTLPSRSPEELMEAFTLLVWAARVAEEAGQTPDAQHLAALSRIAPTLRSLRLGDGSLVRFHGGGRGNVGQLDQSLSDSGIRPQPTEAARMGYARLAAGRTVVLMDGAPPATGLASAEVHASTLAMEMSSGRQPLIVNTGPGRYFGPDWHRAARATACQSTLVVENTSSATVWDEGYVADTLGAWISERPTKVKLDRANDVSGLWVLGSHNGYAADYGLHHDRRMFVSPNGRDVKGEDSVYTRDASDKVTHDRAVRKKGAEGLDFSVHFHLHPDASASLDMAGHAISVKLKSEEVWVFRQSGGELTLEDAVFLDQQRLRPRATKQIVIRGRTEDGKGQVTWALARAQEGSRYTLDTDEDELAPLV